MRPPNSISALCAMTFGLLGAAFVVIGTLYGCLGVSIRGAASSWAFLPIGVVCLLIGLVCALVVRRRRREGRLRSAGIAVPGTIVQVRRHSFIRWERESFSSWRSRTRAGEDTRPYEMRESSGFAVGADDLGGPRAALCAAPTDRARWFGKLRRRRGTASAEFLHTQGPVARIEWRKATQILRAGKILPAPRGNPRNGGPRGAANMDTKCPS